MSSSESSSKENGSWRERYYEVIFGHETPAGKNFDIILLLVILTSVLVAMLDSVNYLHADYQNFFYVLEWGFTILFTVEYFLRLAIVKNKRAYATSFYGIIDLLAILPTYIALFVSGAQFLIVLRILRVLRIFKVLQMRQFTMEAGILVRALARSSRKILVFLLTILTVVTVFGAVMYLVEGPEHGFTSIPMAMYWAIVTVGTVGYGDLAPETPIGRLITAGLILIGYGIIAVPTGIYAAELFSAGRQSHEPRTCTKCGHFGHETGAKYCLQCGHKLGEAM